MKRSESINDLAAALAKAQIEFESAERDHTAKVQMKTGGSYSFSYADLAAYFSVCRKPLGSNGLSFMQEAVVNGSQVSVTTLLMHASGQWIESEPFTLNMVGQTVTPQVVGSGVTYARRYSLSALIGIASETDDDGNRASGNNDQTGHRQNGHAKQTEQPKPVEHPKQVDPPKQNGNGQHAPPAQQDDTTAKLAWLRANTPKCQIEKLPTYRDKIWTMPDITDQQRKELQTVWFQRAINVLPVESLTDIIEEYETNAIGLPEGEIQILRDLTKLKLPVMADDDIPF